MKKFVSRKSLVIFTLALVVLSGPYGCGKKAPSNSDIDMTYGYGFGPRDIVKDDCSKQEAFTADCSGFVTDGAGGAKNIILLIGDGMGINQTYLGRVYVNGPQTPLAWETFPNKGLATTCAIGEITDSAAGGTAISTGSKTMKGAISYQLVPTYAQLRNMVDLFHGEKAAGVVSTAGIWDATPASFTAHNPTRDADKAIALEMVRDTRPEVILGGGSKAFGLKKIEDTESETISVAKASGYTLVRTASELSAIDTSSTKMLLGLFSDGSMTFEVDRKDDTTEPHLSDMASVALDILDDDPRGFFLMIEGGRIDHACHMVSEKKMVHEMAEFNKTVAMVLEWAENRDDTLIIVTADHETGDMSIAPGEYSKGDIIKANWDLKAPKYAYHSSQRVPVYAVGPNAGAVRDHMDNTETFCVMKNAFDPKM